MPIPPGVDPPYVWCLLWLAVEVALLGVSTQLGSLEELRERVTARTYRRLPPLNVYLNRAHDEHWLSGEVVPDHTALMALKREVDRAAYVDTLLRRRLQLLSGCRLLAVTEVACAFLLAVGIASGIEMSALVWPSRIVFGTGTVLAILTLIWCQLVTFRISTGEDMG
jgi:hypothetical protein